MNATSFPRSNAAPTSANQAIALLLGRVLVSTLFILSGLSKVGAPAAEIGYIQSAGLPLPAVAFGIAVVVEIVGGLALLVGYQTRIVAAGLAVFSLATALCFHHQFADQNQLIHFLKNLAIAGGLLNVAVFGGGRMSVDGRRR